jgi:flagellar hook protein FlgE
MPLFSIPLSGLNASSNSLSVIANNLANLNTVGYKEARTEFRDLFYQTIGSNGAGDALQIGAGAGVGAISTVFTGGSVESSGVPTDVAIMGDGFFVTQKDGAAQYTRAGNFTVSPDGSLLTQDGANVMGYPAVAGAIPPGQALTALHIDKGQTSPPNATSSVQMHTNLDAGAAVGDTYSTPITVYDSLGVSHVLNFQFSKTAANTWNYQVTLPAADTGATGAPTVLNSGTLAFDGNGNLTSPATDVTGITVSGLADGASPMNVTWSLFDPTTKAPLVSQISAASSTASTFQNGFGSGSLLNFSIGSDGIIEGSFSNGRTIAIGQLALANFANIDGLLRNGDNSYTPTLASGAAVVGAPGTGGRGSVSGGALELSNVDIAQEFSKMIVAQRGFQANARVVTTFDEITQDTINLKR